MIRRAFFRAMAGLAALPILPCAGHAAPTRRRFYSDWLGADALRRAETPDFGGVQLTPLDASPDHRDTLGSWTEFDGDGVPLEARRLPTDADIRIVSDNLARLPLRVYRRGATPEPRMTASPSERQRLTARREQIVETMRFDGRPHDVCFGFEPGGPVREIFIRGPKSGSDAATFLDDAAVMASLLLQHGYAAADLTPRFTAGGAMQQILRRAAQIDAEREQAA